MTEEVWSVEDEAVFRPLYRKWQRIRSRKRNDANNRKKQYGPRTRLTVSGKKKEK